jgi:GGDEF domain-containing protein
MYELARAAGGTRRNGCAAAFAGRLIAATPMLADMTGSISPSRYGAERVSAYPAWAIEGDTLIRQADHAMYKAKASGKRRVCVAGA